MRVVGVIAGLTVLLATSCSWGSAARMQGETPELFPLARNTTWTYQGRVKWTRAESGEVVEQAVTWKMRVVETIRRGHVFAAVLEGHPSDLAHFENSKAPGRYLIVRVGLAEFYLLRHKRTEEALSRLRDESDALHSLVREEELFLDAPLVPGKVFGPAEQVTRQDGSYYWIVEGQQPIELRSIKGAAALTREAEYQLCRRTRPDHEEISFVPGLGITGYKYAHHGTVSEVEVRLVQYKRGGQIKP